MNGDALTVQPRRSLGCTLCVTMLWYRRAGEPSAALCTGCAEELRTRLPVQLQLACLCAHSVCTEFVQSNRNDFDCCKPVGFQDL